MLCPLDQDQDQDRAWEGWAGRPDRRARLASALGVCPPGGRLLIPCAAGGDCVLDTFFFFFFFNL